jgi:hypothetical protein
MGVLVGMVVREGEGKEGENKEKKKDETEGLKNSSHLILEETTKTFDLSLRQKTSLQTGMLNLFTSYFPF